MIRVVATLVVACLVTGIVSDARADDDAARIRAWLDAGDFARADSLAAARLESSPPRSEERVDALLFSIETARRTGSIPLDDLVQRAEELIALQATILDADDPRIGAAWHQLANTHVRRGDQAAAAVAFREAFTQRRATLGADDTQTIRSALGLANALQWTGDVDGARELFDEQIARLEAHPAGRESRLVFALNGRGYLARRTGDREAALDAFRRALAIAERAMPERHLTRALVERNLGVELASDRPEVAVDHLRRALAIRQALLPDHDVLIGSAALGLARVEERLGRAGSAAAHYARALATLRTEGDRREAWVGRANTAIEAGDFDVAARAIDGAAREGVTPNVVLALRANRANEMGDFEVAVDLYDRVLRRRADEGGRESVEFARLLHNRAEVLARQGRVEAALASRRDAVAIQERLLADDDLDLALGRANLAGSLLETDRAAEALALLDTVEPIVTSVLAPTHPARANVLLLRARGRHATGATAQARRAAESAADVRRAAYGDDHVEVAWALDDLARYALADGASDASGNAAADAARIAREHLRDVVSTLPERQALAFVGAGRTGHGTLVEVARRSGRDDDVRSAFDATVRGRALVLDALLERERAVDAGDSTVVAARAELATARRDLVAAATRGETDPARWRRLRERRERAASALAAISVVDRQRRARRDRGAAHVLDAVRDDEVLVAFTVLEDFDRTVAFVVRDGAVHLVDLGSTTTLDAAIDVWLDAVRAPMVRADAPRDELLAQASSAARALGARIVDPLAPHLDDRRRVWWIADGRLQRVQPAALRTADGEWLADGDLVFAHLGAERDLETRTLRRTTGRVLAIGDPDFGPGDASVSPCPDLATLRFAPLPASRDEVRAVPGATVLTGRDATEDGWRARLPGHDTLHFATHGFFLPAHCTGDADGTRAVRGLRGIGAVTRRTAAAPSARVIPGPLLRSGLALAGANRRSDEADPSDDGILLAEEIAGMRLDGVHTVVLSACDTGVGAIVTGEGVLGLPRAFRRAGAAHVVMSLWPVQDEATRRWMEVFYAARGEGQDVAAAARAARRALRATEAFAHPFFWAAFVAIGPGR